MKLSTKDISICSMASVLIIISAFIRIPIGIVPFTLQPITILTISLILGYPRATISVLLYILLGLIGLPVFASGGGIGYVLYPTFGFLIGFVLLSALVSFFSKRCKSITSTILLCMLGMGIVYTCAITYTIFLQTVIFQTSIQFSQLFSSYVLMFLPSDFIACILASIIARKIHIKKY